MRAFSHAYRLALPEAGRGAAPAAVGRGWMFFAALGTLVSMSARIALSAPSPGADPELGSVDPMNTFLQLALLGFGLFHLLRHPSATLAALLRAWPFALMVAVAAASVTWSQAPEHSLRRAVTLGTVLLFGAAMWEQLGLERFMRVVVGTAVFAAAASLVVAVLRPDIGFDVGDYSNAIRGIFWQKNSFGLSLLAGTLALTFLALDRGGLTGRDMLVFLGFLVMLVLSRSTTALLLSLGVMGATVVALGLDRGGGRRAATIVLTAGTVTIALLAVTLFGSSGLFEAIGKDDTLTGRVYIWAEVLQAIGLRPYFGYGYNAFWLEGTHAAELVWQNVGWAAPTAHNGYLDVALQLGLLGLVVVAGVNLVTLGRAVGAILDGRRRRAFWAVMLTVVYGVYNYSESSVWRPDLQFLLWMMASLSLLRAPRARAQPDSAGPWSFHAVRRTQV